MTKDRVLTLLWQKADRSVSGAELARSLAISRTAVWKAIGQLRDEGYRIESAPGRGYRLSSTSDVLSAEGIEQYRKSRYPLQLQVYKSIRSTNTVLKAMAAEGAEEGLCLIAGEQTEGRGRMGRSFYSPADSGLYLSVLLRPTLPASRVTGITACAAVAVAEAIEELSGRPTQIKWVNDVLVDGKKVCGILTEASLDCESATVNYLVVGIGINTAVPAGDFPAELQGIAGAAFAPGQLPQLRCHLAALVLDKLMAAYAHPDDAAIFESYRSRSLVLGQPIFLLSPGQPPVPATALDIEPDFALLVRCEDGSIRRVQSGEVSIRPRT